MIRHKYASHCLVGGIDIQIFMLVTTGVVKLRDLIDDPERVLNTYLMCGAQNPLEPLKDSQHREMYGQALYMAASFEN